MWHREQTDTNVFRVSRELRKSKDWEAWVLLASDRHWDNPKSNWDLQIKHLKQAQERDAIVIDSGDMMCLMQGKADPRHCKGDIRPEHQVPNHIDKIIEDCAEFFRPYQHLFICVGRGNHESSIKRRLETDPTERFLALLNMGMKHKVYNGHYSGYVKITFTRGKFEDGRSRTQQTFNLKYAHGFGGASKSSQDTAKQVKRAGDAPDADIIVTGHTHNQSVIYLRDERLTDNGRIYHKERILLKAPTYKEEWEKGVGVYHDEQERGPKPVGAWWLRFSWDASSDSILVDPIRAV